MRVLVVFCVHRAVEIESWNSWTKFCLAAHKHDLDVIAAVPKGASIDRCRSYQATSFLDNPMLGDILIFLDDDVVYETDGLLKLIDDCVRTKSIVSGIYPTKGNYLTGTVCDPGNFYDMKLGPDEPIHKTKYVPAGFLAMHRNAVEKLAATIPRCGIDGIIPFFLPLITEVEGVSFYFGEDYSMCKRALDANIDIWVDPSIYLSHIGRWEYTWDDIL